MDVGLNLNAIRVLLVEDDLSSADKLSAILRSGGFAVENAYNVSDALAAAHTRYSAALVKGSMRDRDGISLIDLISRHPDFKTLPLATVESLPHRPDTITEWDEAGVIRVVRGILGLPDSRMQRLVRRPATDTQITPPAPQSPPLVPVPPSEYEDTQTRAAMRAMLAQKLEAQRALSSLGRSISSVLDLNAVLNQIVEAAVKLTKAEEGLLLLPGDEDEALYLRAMKGIDDAHASNFRVKNTEPLIGGVFRTGEPVLIADSGALRVKTQYFVKSLLYVPMRYQGQVIGVLGVNRHTNTLFTQNDLELLLDLAAHAAIAIENARLYEDRVRQNRQLVTLVAAGMALNTTLALPEVLSTFADQVIRSLDASICAIDRVEDGILFPLARSWQAARRIGMGVRLRFEERPMLREALEQNSYYIVSAEQKGMRWQAEAQVVRSAGATHLMVLPIRSGADQPAIGLLELYHRRLPSELTSEKRSRSRSAALEILGSLSSGGATVRISASIFTSAERILETTGAAWFTLLLKIGDGLERVMDFGRAVFIDPPQLEPYPCPPEVQPSLGKQEPIHFHIRDGNIPPGYKSYLSHIGADVGLTMPIMVKGDLFGVFTVGGVSDARLFRPDEINLAWALIGQAVAAIENARLYHDLHQSLSDLKTAQASLVQAARLSTMGQLAAVVAHQINNPLTTVIGDAEMLLMDIPPDDPRHEGVTAIHRAGKRAHEVVKRLLSTARRDQPSSLHQWISVNQTILNTLELVSLHIERKNILLETDLDDSPAFVFASPGHLEDAWLNLLLNGRDALAGRSNPRLRISSQWVGERFMVIVADNGPGIPLEIQQNIFEPFFTTKPPGEGTGLGLYICKQVIESCGGTIHITSAPDQGTIFEVSLSAQYEPGAAV
ncbi:MAG: GAF domain-containing protein [Anaerolineae bacterium]|nr:GAF domain-containing protein [Anaerolineae bacterium]